MEFESSLIGSASTMADNAMTNDSVLIHVGWPKSASTFLQKNVFPYTGGRIASLERPVSDRNPERLIDYAARKKGFDPNLFRDRVKQTSEPGCQKHLIISNETLSGELHGHSRINPDIVAENLKSAFPKARILIVVREQKQYIQSLYAFRVTIRGHETRSLSKFIDEEWGSGLKNRLDYAKYIALYKSLFGDNSVLPVPMESLKISPSLFIDTIFQFSDLGYNNTENDSIDPGHENTHVNSSTRNNITILIMRSINYLFNLILYTRGQMDGLKREQIDPRLNALPPYRGMRQNFYDFKRALTEKIDYLLPEIFTLNADEEKLDLLIGEEVSAMNKDLCEHIDRSLLKSFSYI